MDAFFFEDDGLRPFFCEVFVQLSVAGPLLFFFSYDPELEDYVSYPPFRMTGIFGPVSRT